MIQTRFKILSIVIVVLAFFKIYQHNLLVQLTYEYQRLVQHKKKLEQERNELYIHFLRKRDPERIFAHAQKKLGLHMLTIDQIKHIPTGKQAVDFLHTTSCDAVLKIMGLYDLVIGRTGGLVHVCA